MTMNDCVTGCCFELRHAMLVQVVSSSPTEEVTLCQASAYARVSAGGTGK